jgi:hypothetical protein
MRRALLALGLFLIASTSAFAWGGLGHRLVGELAERQLSPQVREQVRVLLREEKEPTLAGVASWPDEVRDQPTYAWTAPLHYVNIRDKACRFDAKRDCRGGHCVVSAIPRYTRTLSDPALSPAERAEALKFLVHFVGDIHQPLHSGHRPDKGGNEFQVSLRWRNAPRRGTNLHSIWDHFLLASANESETAYAQRLAALPAPEVPTAFDLAAASRRWAEESCALTDRGGFYPPRPGKLPEDYLERMRPLAEARVHLAAIRLAGLIETALAPNAP